MSREAVEESNRAFMEAVRNHDSAAVAARYVEDAVLLPGGAPRIDGRAGIQKYFEQAFAQGVAEINLETTDVQVLDDTVVEIGSASVVIEPPGGARFTDPGKYVVLYRRVDGELRMAVDIWNSDTSPTG